MVHVDDYFLANFLGLFNCMITSLNVAISILLGEIEALDVFKRTSGLNTTSTDSHNQLVLESFAW